MNINPINLSFKSYRVEVSKEYSKLIRKQISTSSVLNILAEKNDVFLKFTPSKTLGNTLMQVFKKGIDHVADIPKYALAHDTGDQVYINWEEKIAELESPCVKDTIESKVKSFFGIVD